MVECSKMIFYKITNEEGLFSTGGMDIGFHKKGKEWREKNHLMSHITQTIHCNEEEIYKNCAIVEVELKEINRYDIGPLLRKKKQVLAEQEELERTRREKRIKVREHKQFLELSKKFDKGV